LKPREQTIGVLQGEPLSPLLFHIATSDIIKAIETNVKFYAYADMVLVSPDIENLQKAFNHLPEWPTDNELQLNEKKTVPMTFRKGGRPAANIIIYKNRPLITVPHFKYLGVTMQTQGNIYTIHIKERIIAAMITMNGIQNICKISLRAALQLFKLKITPITYGINIYWDHLKRSNPEDIEKVKARFLKKAMRLSKYTLSRLV
jgi:hypothetical protein